MRFAGFKSTQFSFLCPFAIRQEYVKLDLECHKRRSFFVSSIQRGRDVGCSWVNGVLMECNKRETRVWPTKSVARVNGFGLLGAHVMGNANRVMQIARLRKTKQAGSCATRSLSRQPVGEKGALLSIFKEIHTYFFERC